MQLQLLQHHSRRPAQPTGKFVWYQLFIGYMYEKIRCYSNPIHYGHLYIIDFRVLIDNQKDLKLRDVMDFAIFKVYHQRLRLKNS